DQLGQAVVLLQIDRKIGFRLLADFGQRLGVLFTIDGNPDYISARFIEQVHQLDGRVDILRVRRRHALDSDRMASANGDRADADGAGWVALELHDGVTAYSKWILTSGKHRPARERHWLRSHWRHEMPAGRTPPWLRPCCIMHNFFLDGGNLL